MPNASVLAEIDAAVADTLAARRETWFDRLPQDVQTKFLAARDKLHAGGYGKVKRSTLGRVLIEYAEKLGLHACDYKRMSEWLAKKT